MFTVMMSKAAKSIFMQDVCEDYTSFLSGQSHE